MKKSIFLGLLCFAMLMIAQASALMLSTSRSTPNSKTPAPELVGTNTFKIQFCGDEGGGGRPGVKGTNGTIA